MNRCLGCGTQIFGGLYCLFDGSLNGWEFNGCDTLPRPKGVSVPGKAHRPLDGTPLPVRSFLDFRNENLITRGGDSKNRPGSRWTSDRYGLDWSDFTRILRSIARKRGIALTGFHVATLAAADMVDGLLTMRRAVV